MPRNITVTLADGSQHVYANAPDNITPDVVTARAQRDFGQSVTALDGGRNAGPAGPATSKNGFGLGAPPAPKGTPERAAYDTEYNKRFNAAWLRANPQQAQDRQIATSARARAAGNANATGDFSTALKAGITRGLFGLPERLAAAGEAYLPSFITGNTTNASYGNILQTIRANTDADLARSTGGNVTGQIIGGVAGGRAIGGAVGALASRAAGAASPVISSAGNFLQNLATLKKGQTIANAGKLALGGGAQGAAQAVGEGSDPVKGAEYGATGAAVFGGGLKAAQVLTRPFRDFLRLSSAGQILSRLTSASADSLATRAQAYRDATGAEPTLFELLPLSDRNKILKQGVVGRDNVVEATSNAVRARAQNLGPEMSNRARAILTPSRNFVENGLVNDITAARGLTTPTPEDAQLARNAATDPTHMSTFRDQEANAIMAPHEDTIAAGNLEDLYPQAPGIGGGAPVMTDPEVARMISTAAGTMRARADNAGVTVGDVTGIMSKLRGYQSKGGVEGDIAERAINHLQDSLDVATPDAGAAARRMVDQYAARSRMMEGMGEGVRTRMRSDVPVGTSRSAAREVRNAYDTSEGAGGRALGQGNKILGDLAGSPEEALRATVGISRNSVGRPLAQNIGQGEADALTAAARAQDESAQALSAASAKAQSGGGEGANAETLVTAIAGLHPSSFITTKAGALRKLMDMTYIPEGRARTIVDMIFSQDPTLARRALRAVGNEKNGAGFVKYLNGAVGGLSGGGQAGDTSADPNAEAPADASPIDASAAESPPAEPVKPGDDPNVPYGRAVISSIFPEAEITEDVRDPNSKLGRENPNSEHIKSQNAVDLRPIKGMSFAQFIGKINDSGYQVVEAIDEVNHPSKWATGKHWHVVVTDGPKTQ